MKKKDKTTNQSSTSTVINDNASKSDKVQTYKKELIEKAEKQIGNIEKEIEELEQN